MSACLPTDQSFMSVFLVYLSKISVYMCLCVGESICLHVCEQVCPASLLASECLCVPAYRNQCIYLVAYQQDPVCLGALGLARFCVHVSESVRSGPSMSSPL